MYPPGPFSQSRGSFQTPVVPPSSQPTDPPLQSVCINQDWLPFVVGALKQLSLQATWKVASDSDLLDVQGRVFNLMSLFLKDSPQCCPGVPDRLCLSGTFADEQYGYQAQVGFDCTNSWVGTTGWQSCLNTVTGQQEVHIERAFPASTFIRDLSFHVNAGVFLGAYDITAIYSLAGVVVGSSTAHIVTGGGSLVDSPNLDMDDIIVEVVTVSSASSNLALDDWSLCYDGPFPLADVSYQWQEILSVSALGSHISTGHSTSPTQTYRIELSGVLVTGSTAVPPILADGVYVTFDNWVTWHETANTYGGGLNLDGSLDVFRNYPFSPAHDYVAYVVGTGSPFDFYFQDSPYTDNSGSISVKVTAI